MGGEEKPKAPVFRSLIAQALDAGFLRMLCSQYHCRIRWHLAAGFPGMIETWFRGRAFHGWSFGHLLLPGTT